MFMDVPVRHVETDSMYGDVRVRCSIVGKSGKSSKLGNDLGSSLWLEKLGLDTGHIGLGGRL